MVGYSIAAEPSEFLRPMPKWTYPCSLTDQPDSTIESSADRRPVPLAVFAFSGAEAPSERLACDEDTWSPLFSRAA